MIVTMEKGQSEGDKVNLVEVLNLPENANHILHLVDKQELNHLLKRMSQQLRILTVKVMMI